MEKAQKAALVKHIVSLTEKFAKTMTPPEASKKATALYQAIKGKFGCQESAVLGLVTAITGEDLNVFKELKKEQVPNFVAFRVAKPKGNWKENEIMFVANQNYDVALGMRDTEQNVDGTLNYREGQELVPATAKEIEAALNDVVAEKIVRNLNILFL